jgi:hypothetical protein
MYTSWNNSSTLGCLHPNFLCTCISILYSVLTKHTSMMQNIYLGYIQWHYRHFHMLYQRLAIYFLKVEYIIQVMNSAVKDKWGAFMLGFCLSFWYFWLVCFVLYLFVFDNRLISNFISVFFCFEDIASEGPTR